MPESYLSAVPEKKRNKESIKIKIASIIAVTLIGLILIILILSSTIITTGFSKIESDIAKDNINRALNAISADIDRLDVISDAWSSSDEIKSFIESGDLSIPRTVFSDGRLLDSGINILIITDSSGNVIWHKYMNLKYDHQSPTPKSLLGQFEKNAGFLCTTSSKGIVLLNSGPMIIASEPVLLRGNNSPGGILSVGRYLDDNKMDSLSDITQLSLSVEDLKRTKNPFDILSSDAGSDTTPEMIVDPISLNQINGYTVLDDIYGNPAVLLTVRMSRDIAGYATGLFYYQILSIIFAGSIFGVVILFLIQRSVVSRIEDLNNQVDIIGGENGKTERLSFSGDDEISSLGFAINNMLDSIEKGREQYSRLFEEANDLILTLDSSGKIMSANKKTESITGYGRDELKNMKFRDFLLPDSSENIMDLLFSISSGGSSVKHEVAIKNRAGKEKILELSVQIHSWKKKDRCLFIIARDVTVKKKAEEELSLYRSHLEDIVSRRTKELETANTELAEEKERITVTLESIADGVMTTDDRNNVVIINSSASEISGFAPNEASGSHVSDIIELSDKDMNNIDELLNCVMAKRRPAEICADLLIRKTGKEIPVMLSAAPISAGGSDASGCVIVFRDISERIRFEEEVLKRQKLESIGILAGGIAHDFNNILTSIAGNIMIAKNSVPEDDPVYKRLNEAEKAVIRAKDITGQLITFSKGGTPVKQTSDIRDLITETAEFVSHGSSIKLHTDIECGLKPVDVDEGQISQVIENLVINAIQAMPEGGNIYITAVNEGMISGAENLSDGEYISISVTDEGSGINSENLKKIFDPYFTTKKKGNGLGLASCLSIIRKHGGNIIVKSKAGTGSEFKIYLPVSDKPVAEKGADYEGRLCGSGRILLMDDDINICNTVPDLLRSYGFDVDFATDGAEAIRKYQETKTLGRDYDLYIFDLTVPGGLGGVDTIKILKEFEPKIKAIVSSGYFDDPVMANYADYGFSAVFPKPYDFKKLIAVINKLIHE